MPGTAQTQELVSPRRTPSLAALAAAAAIALDRRAHGIESSLDAVHALAQRLRQAVPEVSPAKANLLEPIVADLFERAFTNILPGEQLQTVHDLTEKASAVVEELTKATANANHDEAATLRDFCVALAQSAQIQSAAGRIISTHPNRR